MARCLALIRTDVRARPLVTAAASPAGYGPTSLQWAYKLPSTAAGGGRTVAIVDAYDDPNAASDLAAYRSQYGLPACTAASGCFTKVNEFGQASPLPAASGSTGWATEESLDIDMVSAACPNCRILLVEASSPAVADLGTAVNSAVSRGVKFISNSYGAAEFSTEGSDDSAYYNHPGVAITASAGDSGYRVSFPAASPHVVAVGGTSLTQASGSRGWAETAWNGTGSGCSAYEPKPSWQAAGGCARRTDNDVSAVADPNTGLAVYDSYDQGGWVEVGGTSAASPIIAATYALGGYPAAGSYPASSTYAQSAPLFDVTSGANGSCSPTYLCTAGPGYDGPTGLGTPNGAAAFTTGAGPGNEAAFQASTGHLWVEGSGGTSDTGLGMAAKTSPSIAGLTGGGYEVAFQASTGHLWVEGSGGTGDTGLGMAAGTSPSIVALPGGGYEVAFQASTGHLWVEGSGGTGDTGLTMMPGTSPDLAELPPENNPWFPNGGTEAVFQGSDGHPWDYSAIGGGGSMSNSVSMAPGTSPAIVPTPSGGAFQALWQGANNHLWTTGAGPTDTGLTMMPGTSPNITTLS
ncbi:MAG TPA: S53 family peptidase [Streptosporangiaceae bacterium]